VLHVFLCFLMCTQYNVFCLFLSVACFFVFSYMYTCITCPINCHMCMCTCHMYMRISHTYPICHLVYTTISPLCIIYIYSLCIMYYCVFPCSYQLHWALLYGQCNTTHCIWAECWELIEVCSLCCLLSSLLSSSFFLYWNFFFTETFSSLFILVGLEPQALHSLWIGGQLP